MTLYLKAVAAIAALAAVCVISVGAAIASPGREHVMVPPAPTTPALYGQDLNAPGAGFAWGDFGIGVAGTLGAVVLGAGTIVGLRRRGHLTHAHV
jgi:hypothetical protein